MNAVSTKKSTLKVECTCDSSTDTTGTRLKLRNNKAYDSTDNQITYSVWINDGGWVGPLQVVPKTFAYKILNPTTLNVDNVYGHMTPRKWTKFI